MSSVEATGPAGGQVPVGEDLRALVRDVLRDALPELVASASLPVVEAAPQAGRSAGARAEQWVRVQTDDDLVALVRRVARECIDPARRAELAADGGGLRLEPPAEPVSPQPPEPPDAHAVLRVERGAVTERHVRDAGRTGATIVAARGVVLTPLARDRARSTGVDIERER